MPFTPLCNDNDAQLVAGTPGPAFGSHTQLVMGTPFGGNETPVAGTPTTTARSIASSRIGWMDLPRWIFGHIHQTVHGTGDRYGFGGGHSGTSSS